MVFYLVVHVSKKETALTPEDWYICHFDSDKAVCIAPPQTKSLKFATKLYIKLSPTTPEALEMSFLSTPKKTIDWQNKIEIG